MVTCIISYLMDIILYCWKKYKNGIRKTRCQHVGKNKEIHIGVFGALDDQELYQPTNRRNDRCCLQDLVPVIVCSF